MRGVIATGRVAADDLVDKARAIPLMEGSDLVQSVTCATPFDWTEPLDWDFVVSPGRRALRPLRIAAYDFGIKWNILRRLTAYGCAVRVFPPDTPPRQLLAPEPHG